MMAASKVWKAANPRGSIYTTIMELGPQNHNGDGLLGPNSIMVVYMDPLGMELNPGIPIKSPSRASPHHKSLVHRGPTKPIFLGNYK